MRLDPILVPDLVSGLRLKDYMCAIMPLDHFAKISEFSMLLITYRESVAARNLSTLRSDLEPHPCSRRDAGTGQESSTGRGLSNIYSLK